MFEQTMNFFKPLYRQLRSGTVVPEMKAGLWMIIEAILQRNYLAAYDIYMHLAIGTTHACLCVYPMEELLGALLEWLALHGCSLAACGGLCSAVSSGMSHFR